MLIYRHATSWASFKGLGIRDLFKHRHRGQARAVLLGVERFRTAQTFMAWLQRIGINYRSVICLRAATALVYSVRRADSISYLLHGLYRAIRISQYWQYIVLAGIYLDIDNQYLLLSLICCNLRFSDVTFLNIVGRGPFARAATPVGYRQIGIPSEWLIHRIVLLLRRWKMILLWPAKSQYFFSATRPHTPKHSLNRIASAFTVYAMLSLHSQHFSEGFVEIFIGVSIYDRVENRVQVSQPIDNDLCNNGQSASIAEGHDQLFYKKWQPADDKRSDDHTKC